MAKTSDQLTVDYRTIMSIPPRDRRALLSSGTIDPLLGVLTPGQRVALFPDYFKQQISEMAGQRSAFGPTTGTQTINAADNPGLVAAIPPTGGSPNNMPVRQVQSVQLSGARERPGENSEFYDRAYQAVYKAAVERGVPNPEVIARLGAAQAAIETGYGKHQVGNNYFGIKGKGVKAATQEFRDGRMVSETAEFAAYGGLDDSAAGYVEFLQKNKRYAALFTASSVDQAIAIQGTTGYATDPQYGSKLASINSNYGVNAPTATPVFAELPNDQTLASVADDTAPVGGDPNSATAVPEAVMRTGGIPIPAAMSAVDRALTAVGLDERENKEELKKYLTGGIQDPATQAWCASFVNAALASSGMKGTGSNIANSFQEYGMGVDFQQTQKGDIVVRTRGGGPDDPGGHVMMATGRTRINERTGQLEVEIVGGNQSDAVTTRYVSAEGLMVRRPTEANLAEPPPRVQAEAPQSPGAEPVQTTSELPAPQTDVTPTTTPDATPTAPVSASAPGLIPSPTDMLVGAVSNWWNGKPEEKKPNPQLAAAVKDTSPIGVPTSSMAAGGVITEPHTAINNRTGERVNIGEVGTGGEAIVPMNKVRANEVGQQPYQMPVQAPAPDARMPKQVDVDKKEPMPKNATGQQVPTTVAIAVDHQVVPPSARKAYADAGLEHRFNNFSSVGTQYRNFGL